MKNYKDKANQLRLKINQEASGEVDNDIEDLPFTIINEHLQVSHLFDKDFQELDLKFEGCEDPLIEMLD